MNETAFYVLGIIISLLAVGVTALGLRRSDAFSSRAATTGLVALFGLLVAGTATFAVLYSEEEQEHREAELAAEEAEQGTVAVPDSGDVPVPAGPGRVEAEQGTGTAEPGGPGGRLALAADPTQLAYDTSALESKPGDVTIDFDNPAPISHDVAIEKDGSEVAKTELIAEAETSVTAALGPGEYVFYCSVPGHREAGMEGSLTVK